MTLAPAATPQPRRPGLSVDGWAVAVSLALALLVKVGILQHVPW